MYTHVCNCGYLFRVDGEGWRCETGRWFSRAEIDEDHGRLTYYYDEESD